MAIKPQNVIPILKDKIIVYPPTAAADAAGYDLDGGGLTDTLLMDSLDTENDWEVVELFFVVTTATDNVTDQVKLGTTGRPVTSYDTAVTQDAVHFADDEDALHVVSFAGDKIQIPLKTATTAPKVLKAGCILRLAVANSANVGKGYFGVRLRPQEKARGNASKRGKVSYPVNAAAQNPNA